VLKQNGVPYPGTVLIDGKPVRSNSGTFYLEYYEDKRRVQKPVGRSPREAKNAWYAKLTVPITESQNDEAQNSTPELTTVAAAFARFLEETRATKEDATYTAYRRDLEWVRANLKREFVNQVTREDFLRLLSMGREAGLNTKTITRRLIVALMALRNSGAVISLQKGDWPKLTDKSIQTYDKRDIEKFFAYCDPGQRLLFQTFLCTGFRKREVNTLTWNDINFRERTVLVQPKTRYTFTPKNHEERAVPVPGSLIRELSKWKKTHEQTELVFPTPPHPKRSSYGGKKPNDHHLELCKQIAWRARLNCRHCLKGKRSCAKGPYCENWTLHKWRHTYATNLLRSGVDIKSLQILLGHKNLATTEKYLRSLGVLDLRGKIEKSSIAALIKMTAQ
jgi:integrase/recombinase XerD